MIDEGNFVLDKDGFYFNKIKYNYKDITAIEFYYVQTEGEVDSMFRDKLDRKIDISIYLSTQPEPIKISSGSGGMPTSLWNRGERESEFLTDKFDEISKRTFKQRSEKYLNALEQNGYFDYDGKRIYKDGRVVSEKWELNLMNNKQWYATPFTIYHFKKGKGFFGLRKKFKINTLRDCDVFKSILLDFYGLNIS